MDDPMERVHLTGNAMRIMPPEALPMRLGDAYRVKEALRQRGFADVGVHRPVGTDPSHGYIVTAFLCGHAIEMRTTGEADAFVARIEAVVEGDG